jgi:TRAP-type mannitol/chloroaromatic compound transport system permease small subunit
MPPEAPDLAVRRDLSPRDPNGKRGKAEAIPPLSARIADVAGKSLRASQKSQGRLILRLRSIRRTLLAHGRARLCRLQEALWGRRRTMRAALALSRAIDRCTAVLGQSVSWLILAAILVSAGNAVSRKLFSLSSNAYLELQWYLFGAAYFLAASYTLQRNEHIRIDIVSNALPRRVRDCIELFGHLVMLIPFAAIMVWEMWPSMLDSYRIGETSANYGGLLIWPAKALILAGFALLVVQGISETIKRIAVMAGRIPDPHVTAPAEVPIE